MKEKNPDVKIWGVDSYGSVFKKYHETGEFDEKEIYSYITEGIGEDILPKNVDFSLIDRFEKVTDRDGAMVARELAKKEGLFLGYSCGSAFQAIRQLKNELDENSVVVVLFHDHGSRYVGKVFNDTWMRDRGFLNEEKKVARDLFANHKDLPLLTIGAYEPIHNAIALMRKFGVSQLPVVNGSKFVGSIDDSSLLTMLSENQNARDAEVSTCMQPPFPVVQATDPLTGISKHFNAKNGAVLVDLGQGRYQIITRHDLVSAMS